jgi:hypothetical protein
MGRGSKVSSEPFGMVVPVPYEAQAKGVRSPCPQFGPLPLRWVRNSDYGDSPRVGACRPACSLV